MQIYLYINCLHELLLLGHFEYNISINFDAYIIYWQSANSVLKLEPHLQS